MRDWQNYICRGGWGKVGHFESFASARSEWLSGGALGSYIGSEEDSAMREGYDDKGAGVSGSAWISPALSVISLAKAWKSRRASIAEAA